MKTWNRQVTELSMQEIMVAVADDEWQKFRLSLKGRTTETKLDMLSGYLQQQIYLYQTIPRVAQIRIDNYINALLRGGQLVHKDGEIVVQR